MVKPRNYNERVVTDVTRRQVAPSFTKHIRMPHGNKRQLNKLKMANNFFLSQDPLLYQSPFTQGRAMNESDLQKQYNETMQQYKYYQQQQQNQPQVNGQYGNFDYVEDLDRQMRDLSTDMREALMENGEYAALNGQLADIINKELMSTIKWRINGNNIAVQNINRQLEIIGNLKRDMDSEQRRNMSELNDYVKNYSNITFDEYKRIKSEVSQASDNVNDMTQNNNRKNTKK